MAIAPEGTLKDRSATPPPGGFLFPAPDDDHLLRREAFLLLFCAAFAATVFLLWAWFSNTVLEGYSEEARRPIENLKDILGPFFTAYVAARLYSSMMRHYEKQLQRERDLLAHISATSADGIVTLDATDHITTWNGGAQQIFGYQEDEVLGRHAAMLFPPDTEVAAELRQLREAVKAEGLVRTHYGERMTRDGRRIRVEVSTTVLRDARGRYAGRASIFRDVTERDRTRDELARRESLAAIGEMAAAVAHEIKNPLAGIGGAVKVLGRGFPADDPRAEVIEEIQQQVRRLDDTIRDLLTFARPTVPRFAIVETREFAERVLRVLGEEPVLKRHEVALDVPENLRLRADPQLLENVALNLLLNAGQALGQKPGRIVFKAEERAGHAVLSVIDNGPGIREEVLAKLFRPFFTTKARGTGLGLTIVKKFVEVMGGRIEVATQLGGGTTFSVLLPAVPARGEAE